MPAICRLFAGKKIVNYWFKEAEASDTPGRNMRMFRRFAKLTQPQLAEKLGTTKQVVSNMENGIRPISKKMAKELARI